jgi:hypothetical protein
LSRNVGLALSHRDAQARIAIRPPKKVE